MSGGWRCQTGGSRSPAGSRVERRVLVGWEAPPLGRGAPPAENVCGQSAGWTGAEQVLSVGEG